MALKIGLVGAAGTGKFFLAKEVVAKLKKAGIAVDLAESKSIIKAILDRDRYDYGSGVQVEKFLANGSRQLEILRRLAESQVDLPKKKFVADRTFIDLAAYAMMELHDDDTTLLREIFFECKRLSKVYTHLFLCPWEDKPVDDNHLRTLNPWYQHQIYLLARGVMADWGLKFVMLRSASTEGRVKEIVTSVRK